MLSFLKYYFKLLNMVFRHRTIETSLRRAARAFPALLVTGPRRSGKTTLLRRLFPRADYRLLEDPDVLARVREDPRGFLDSIRLPVILDEIQNAPELLRFVRSRIDAKPAAAGRWLLTGSQEAPLMRGVTESMAGRVAVFQLLPFSMDEHTKVDLLRGGFPEVLAKPAHAQTWFRSYVQTYLERDVRAVTSIRDLSVFRRFMTLLATRHGQVLNRSDLAAPLGVSVPTLSQWLSILEVTGQIVLLPPFYENFGKRLIKSPKVYFVDSGLVCHLLGIETQASLLRSPFVGSLFEGFVASELLKAQIHRGRRREFYYFRDQQGLEIDFVVPLGAGRLALLEAKHTRTPTPKMAGGMDRLVAAAPRYRTECWVVLPPGARLQHAGLGPRTKAVSVQTLASDVLHLRG